MLEARTVSISIHLPWKNLYQSIWEPEFFPKWASGLAESTLVKEGDRWKASGPEGAVKIRFTDHNDYGIMDHFVDTGSDHDVYVPMRVMPNLEGAEVTITIFRQPGMTEEKFRFDIAWVEKDLKALKAIFER